MGATETQMTEQALDMMQAMYTRAITRDETVAIYREAVSVWQMKINRTWHATPRKMHACTAKTCTMDALRIDFTLIRGPDYTDIVNVRVRRQNDDNEYYGGKYPHSGGANPPLARGETIVCGELTDAYVCAATSLLHICNEKLCGGHDGAASGSHSADTETSAGTVCTISGIPYGGAPMVHKFWKPVAVASSSEGSGLTRRDALAGRMAFARQRRSCISSQGATWSNFKEWLDTVPLAMFDTQAAMHRTVKDYSPKRDTESDAYNEYVSWAIARVASLFSATRFSYDVADAAKKRVITERHIQRIVRASDRVLTITDIRSIQVEHMRRNSFPLSFTLPETHMRNIIEIYALKCVSYWGTIRANACPPNVLPAEFGNRFIFPDFVVACMYIFSKGLYLPPDVTHTHTGEHVIAEDGLLKWTLPNQALIQEYTCDKNAVIAQEREITNAINEAVRDNNVDPMRFIPNVGNLSEITIDILPPLTRNRKRKR